MSSRRPPLSRSYEGPAELFQPGVLEDTVFDGRSMPGGSLDTYLTNRYGPEGTGWGIEGDQYADLNELKDVAHEPEFRLAQEALRNLIASGSYALDDGTNVQGRVRSYAREPDMVNVVVYPDGKIFAVEQQARSE